MNFFHLPNTCVHGHLTVTLVSTEWNSGTGQVRPGPKLTGVQVSKRVKSSLSKLVLHRIKKKKKGSKAHGTGLYTMSEPTAHCTETADSDKTTGHELHARFVMLKSKHYVPSIL